MTDDKPTPPPNEPEQRPEDRILEELRNQGEHVKETLKDWGIDLDRFAERAKEAGDGAKRQFQQALDDLQAQVDKQQQTPATPPEATPESELFDQLEQTWEDIKTGVQAASEDLNQRLDEMIERSEMDTPTRAAHDADRAEDRANEALDRYEQMLNRLTGKDRPKLPDDDEN